VDLMPLRSETIQRWWPTTQSLDLVEGSIEVVAAAVHAEVTRFVAGQALAATWMVFPDLDLAFTAAGDFANVPTCYLVLPTRSRWSVLWNNSFLCDGYDALCHCLTMNHRLTTLHWSAHDEWTTFQSGAMFHHRCRVGEATIERSVHVVQTDRQWSFHQFGEALPEEDVGAYAAKRKRDRFNEALAHGLLARLGAEPWSDGFYALAEQRCFMLRRTSPPASIISRSREEVIRRRARHGASDEE
jgi:hypothetical protein